MANNEAMKINTSKIIPRSGDEAVLNSRWSYTALDYKFKEYAVEDEILIDKKTGQVLYKRQDGKIVSYVPPMSNASSNTVLINEINSAILGMLNAEDPLVVRIPDNLSSIMGGFTFPLEDRVTDQDIVNSIDSILDIEFEVDPSANGFFGKVNSRYSDAPYIELLTTLYNTANDDHSNKNATLEYSVRFRDTDDNITDKFYKVDFKLNKLEFFPVDCRLDNPDNPLFDVMSGDINSVKVTINKLTSKKISQMYQPEHLTLKPFSAVINEDGKIIIDDITITTFMGSMDDIPTSDNMIINTITSSTHIIDESKKVGGMTEEEKKEITELKQTVADMPRFVITPQPIDVDKIRSGDMWVQLTSLTPEEEKLLNVTGTNVTFNKEELELYLIENPELMRPFTMDKNDSKGIFIELTN